MHPGERRLSALYPAGAGIWPAWTWTGANQVRGSGRPRAIRQALQDVDGAGAGAVDPDRVRCPGLAVDDPARVRVSGRVQGNGDPGRLTDGLLILPGGGCAFGHAGGDVGFCGGFEGGGMGFGY